MSTMTNIRPLPEDLQKIACDELNEVPQQIAQDLKDFKEWIEKQPHLTSRTDDQFLISFLRGCKYSMEKAKSKIDKFYTLKTKYPDFCTIQNMDSSKVTEIFNLGIVLHLPMPLNGSGPRIQYIRLGHYPTDKFSFSDVMCVANAYQEIRMRDDDYCVVSGYIQIFDLSELSASHMLQLTPTATKKFSTFAEDAVPLRLKYIHAINSPAAFYALHNMLKPLMTIKQQQRMIMYDKNWEALYEHVPQKYLPKELGGENGSIEEITKQQSEHFNNYRDYFILDAKYKVDEKQRVGKTADYDHIFGVEGSFRKLNVD